MMMILTHSLVDDSQGEIPSNEDAGAPEPEEEKEEKAEQEEDRRNKADSSI